MRIPAWFHAHARLKKLLRQRLGELEGALSKNGGHVTDEQLRELKTIDLVLDLRTRSTLLGIWNYLLVSAALIGVVVFIVLSTHETRTTFQASVASSTLLLRRTGALHFSRLLVRFVRAAGL